MSDRVVQLKPALLTIAVFTGLTLLMTWPLAARMQHFAVNHYDIYFNMWRLEWLAHALTTPSARLFDGNTFYPEPRTLALSDAVLLEGSVSAPLIWLGLNPLFVQNVIVLAGIVLSGAAMFALVFYLTGSRGAAALSGIIFSFAPYRFEHFMHMELQWAMWMPLAFLFLHRTLELGGLRRGLLMGAMTALQMLSSIYYGIFLITLLAVCGALFLVADRRVSIRRVGVPLVAGALVAATISALYAIPYLRTRNAIGERPQHEIVMFSARPSSYVVATPNNWIYGRTLQSRGGQERRLFPGTTATLLGAIGLLLTPPSSRAIVYVIAMTAAFETSLGFRGYAYRFLYEYLPIYRGLRAPARLGVLVLMFLAILAAYGYIAVTQKLGTRARRAIWILLVAVLLTEYHVTMDLIRYPTEAPPVYRLLARYPPGVVAEFPVPKPGNLPGPEAFYTYMSTFHWFPLVNGYSGMYPRSYLRRLTRLAHFPDSTSLNQLRRDTVRYVIVHSDRSSEEDVKLLVELQKTNAFTAIGNFPESVGTAYLFLFR
jgi:hypothetical protein